MKEVLGEKSRKAILLFEDAAKKINKLSYDIAGLASQKEASKMYQETRNFVALLKKEIKKFNLG